MKCARCVGPRLRLYFFIFFYFFAKLDKIEISLFGFPSFIFLLILTISRKICVILGTIGNKFKAFGQNWANLRKIGGLLGSFGQICDKLGGFWAELDKFEKNWGAFGQNWANLRKIGAPFTFVLRYFFPIAPPNPVAYRITERVSSWKMFNLKAILGNAWQKNLD